MNTAFIRFVCRILVVCMAALPFQAGAGLVSTGEAVGNAAASPAAPELRASLVGRLEGYGLAADTAKARIAALSDAEVTQLSGELERLPAGAAGVGVGMLLVLIFLVWRFGLSDQAQAEMAKGKPKPAPEKK